MYQLISAALVRRLSDGATIPLPANESEGWAYEAWRAEGNKPLPDTPKTDEELATEMREAFKAQRTIDVSAIGVTTSLGRTFDGDELSQGRMARAILGLQAAGEGAQVRWVLSDNSLALVGAEELSEALMLAGSEQARLWLPGNTLPESGVDTP